MSNPIPSAALAHHIAILGKTGSGKSNAAKVIVEAALDRQERVCVLDPTGAWYGLRLTAQGKPSPYPVVIFGGQHADVQVAAGHGAAIAEIIGTSSTPAVIDTRLMTVGDRTRFFTDFAETLLRKNSGPLTLVIDEAHLFAPQGRVADPQSGKMLHAANNLVSLGRSIGLRVIMLSQRPAKLHKDSLTQVETLVAMRLIAPQDRAAIDAWIGEWAEPGQGKEIIASLPSLPTGDAWIWSPEIGVLKRDHFPLAATFDSGKAPAAGAKGVALALLDLKVVNERLGAVAAEIVANDPRTLRAEIARLTRELAAKPKGGLDVDALGAACAEAEKAGFERGLTEGVRRGTVSGQAIMLGRAQGALNALRIEESGVSNFSPSTEAAKMDTAPAKAAPNAPPRQSAPAPASLQSDGNAALTGPQRRVLDALAWWLAFGIRQPTNEQVGFIASYSPSSGGFANLKGGLRGLGLVQYPAGGRLALTPEGEAVAAPPALDVTRDAFHAQVRAKLTGPQVKVLDPILAAYPDPITSLEVADIASYSASSGGFANLRGSLRTIGLIDYPAPGQVRAADWLFPEGGK